MKKIVYLLCLCLFFGFTSFACFRFLLIRPTGSLTVAELRSFKGRILPRSSVNSHSFEICVPWQEVAAWGNDSVLSYRDGEKIDIGLQDDKDPLIEVWVPDTSTPGAFRYAALYFDTNVFQVPYVTNIENGVVHYDTVNSVFANVVFGIAGVLSVIVCGCLLFFLTDSIKEYSEEKTEVLAQTT